MGISIQHDEVEATPDSWLEQARLAQKMIAAAPILDSRTAEEIIGYDDNGLPT